jgi:hypothetical protein
MADPRRDIIPLFSPRVLRLFAYGALSVVLALYLHEIGLGGEAIGLLFTLTLIGDAGISFWITAKHADVKWRTRPRAARDQFSEPAR